MLIMESMHLINLHFWTYLFNSRLLQGNVCLALPHRVLRDYRRFCCHPHVANVPFVESLSKVQGTPNHAVKLKKNN